MLSLTNKNLIDVLIEVLPSLICENLNIAQVKGLNAEEISY